MSQIIFQILFELVDVALAVCTILVTIVIAFFAYRISRSQYKIQRYQLKHDLYEKRFLIFEELKKEYGDYGDGALMKRLKEKHDGIVSWMDKNEDHLSFLFEDVVLVKAKILEDALRKSNNEFFKEYQDGAVVKSIDSLFLELKKEISKYLKFKNLK